MILGVDESLPRSLESKRFGQPLALGTAIRHAIADRKIVSVNDFLQPQTNTYARTFSSITWNAAGWAFRQLGITDKISGEDIIPTGRYVVMSNVETVCLEFKRQVSEQSSHFDRVFTRLQFQTLFASKLVAGQCLSEEDLEVLLTFLARDKRFVDYNGEVVRIRHQSDEPGISEEDAAIASIKELTANLRHQTDVLNNRIEYLHRETKSALERKNRVAAQALLKSRKLAELSLTKRYATLSQLEDIAARVEQASDQVQLVNVMKSSADALRNLNSRVGGSDRVGKVVDQIRDQMSEVDEVAAILAESTGEPIDELDIDDELKALEKEAHDRVDMVKEEQAREEESLKTQQAQADLATLPNPPTEISLNTGQSNTQTIEAGVHSLSLSNS